MTILIIVGIALAIALVVWYFLSRRVTPTADGSRPIAATMRMAAPGIDPQTGIEPPAPPPPPPPATPGAPVPGRPKVENIVNKIKPSAALSHVPIVGTALVTTTLKPAQIANSVTTRVNNVAAKSLEHIPVVGQTLAAPLKAANKVTSFVSSLW